MPVDDDSALGPEAFGAAEDDFVPVFFARDRSEADLYCELLSDHDIPARTGEDDVAIGEMDVEHLLASQRGMTHGVPVVVPETLLDEASEVIADREDFTEFDEDEGAVVEDDDEDKIAMVDLVPDDELLVDDEDEDEEEDSFLGDAKGLVDLDDDEEDIL